MFIPLLQQANQNGGPIPPISAAASPASPYPPGSQSEPIGSGGNGGLGDGSGGNKERDGSGQLPETELSGSRLAIMGFKPSDPAAEEPPLPPGSATEPPLDTAVSVAMPTALPPALQGEGGDTAIQEDSSPDPNQTLQPSSAPTVLATALPTPLSAPSTSGRSRWRLEVIVPRADVQV